MASAACGVARIGASAFSQRRSHGRSCARAQKPIASTTDSAVASRPTRSVSASVSPRPGVAISSRQASSEKAVRPSAGR